MILGASRYYARSIRKAKAAGYHVIAVDRVADADGFRDADAAEVADITDRHTVLTAARRHAIDGILPLNDFGVETAAHVASALGLVGLTPEAAAVATRKPSMRAAWDRAGLPAVRWRSASTVAEALDAADDIGCWPLIVKPANSRGGASRGVSIVESPAAVPDAVAFAQEFYPDDREVIIEEFVAGIEHSVETMTWNGTTHVLAISDKVKTPPPYRVDTSVDYPTRVSGSQLAALIALVRASVRALGIDVGAAHVEVCTTPEGPRLFELGARCGGGGTPDPIVPQVSGVDMLAEAARLHAGDAPARLDPIAARGCSYRFLTPPPGRLVEVRGLDEVLSWPGILDGAVLAPVGSAIRPVRVGADRAGFVIAGGDTRDEAVRLADAAERAIHFIRA